MVPKMSILSFMGRVATQRAEGMTLQYARPNPLEQAHSVTHCLGLGRIQGSAQELLWGAVLTLL